MSRVLVLAPSPVPFVFGGAERLWWDLCRALQQLTPHEVELWKLPSPEHDFWSVVEGYERFFRCDAGHFDRVIVTKYPAWMVQHPYKIVYLQHRLRGLYDTYPQDLPVAVAWPKGAEWKEIRAALERPPCVSGAETVFAALKALRQDASAWGDLFALPSPLLRACVHYWDAVGLAPEAVRRYAAISARVRARPGYFPAGVEVRIVPHPSGLSLRPEVHRGRQEVIFLTASRWDRPKRLHWVIEAFRSVEAPQARLWVAGWGPEEGRLRALAQGDERIRFLGRLSDAELASAYAAADAVVFVPYDEDMGLVTLEALGSGCPVVTCADSGGVCEFVEDGVNGWICPPEVSAIAQRLQAIAEDPESARQMGEQGIGRAARVRWEGVISALGLAVSQGPRIRRLLVLAPFPLREPLTGGPRRVLALYRALSAEVPIRILCLGGEAGRIIHHPPQLVIEELGWPEGLREASRDWGLRLGVSAGDWAIWAEGEQWSGLRARVRFWLPSVDAVVLSHPYTAPLLPGDWEGPVIYDAHNIECELKSQMWQGEAAAEALRHLTAGEEGVVRRAQMVWYVSEEDRAAFARRWPDLQSGRRWICVPNGWDPKGRIFALAQEKRQFRLKAGLPHPEKPVGIFVGSWHEPNVEAALWLLHHAVPRLPQWQWWILGSVCEHPQVAQASQRAGVFNWGQVTEPELAALLAAADVGWNPVVFGSGSNLKVLDYAGSGALVVTTPFGARGFGSLAQSALVGEREELPMRVLETDGADWDELRLRAQAAAKAFSWERIAAAAWEQIEQLSG